MNQSVLPRCSKHAASLPSEIVLDLRIRLGLQACGYRLSSLRQDSEKNIAAETVP
jgi:hypothetical protein